MLLMLFQETGQKLCCAQISEVHLRGLYAVTCVDAPELTVVSHMNKLSCGKDVFTFIATMETWQMNTRPM